MGKVRIFSKSINSLCFSSKTSSKTLFFDKDDNDNLTISEIYVDNNLSSSQSSIGIITATAENDFIRLQIENNVGGTLEVRANVVGLGSTSAGIGTHRFSVSGQPAGAETVSYTHLTLPTSDLV